MQIKLCSKNFHIRYYNVKDPLFIQVYRSTDKVCLFVHILSSSVQLLSRRRRRRLSFGAKSFAGQRHIHSMGNRFHFRPTKCYLSGSVSYSSWKLPTSSSSSSDC